MKYILHHKAFFEIHSLFMFSFMRVVLQLKLFVLFFEKIVFANTNLHIELNIAVFFFLVFYLSQLSSNKQDHCYISTTLGFFRQVQINSLFAYREH